MCVKTENGKEIDSVVGPPEGINVVLLRPGF